MDFDFYDDIDTYVMNPGCKRFYESANDDHLETSGLLDDMVQSIR